MRRFCVPFVSVFFILALGPVLHGQPESPSRAPAAPSPQQRAQEHVDPRVQELKARAATDVDGMATLVQQIVDSVFSFGELGYQEVETSRYLTDLLEEHGFTIERGVAGMPTAWLARWGSGKPVIALGSDIDGIPRASQKPGVAYHDPLVAGAPGHGEGHNSGQAVNIVAALAVKSIMEREELPGTLVLWPGVAEELVGGKAYLIRAGLFKDVDVCLFSHVGNAFDVSWGATSGTGLVSIEYTFQGETAHSAGAPWRGRSALDAVELMNIGWNFRREHLRLQHRSHYIIPDGGDQPNVVPSRASVWYYFRETEYPRIKELWDLGNTMAEAAAMMSGAKLMSTRVLGSAWPRHFNKVVAETMYANIEAVGMPDWDEADQALAKAVQRELKVEEKGLETEIDEIGEPVEDEDNRGGGSDDIGDVSWVVPTVTLRYPANIPNLPGHNWSNAIAMATPIAHKGAVAGAQAMAMTLVDLLTQPALVDEAWTYFRDVQTKDIKYTPLIRSEDEPATELNRDVMDRYRSEMRQHYYDPTRYTTYLEQLGIEYPTVRTSTSAAADQGNEKPQR
ncbi:MAG: amidohydrolase [Luteitalea sp.]|nr:amidohydrolase [Luteitalea sp.]